MVKIAPSILSADFAKLGSEVDKVIDLGCEILHFDVMDGHFVNNISYGPVIYDAIKGKNILYDVHLMVTDPIYYSTKFKGADYITFHYEALKTDCDIIKCIETIKAQGSKVGISIKPKTEVKEISKYLGLVDLVLVMSVEPGFGGQSFIASSLDKIKELYDLRDANCYHYEIEVDGGINDKTYKACLESGVDILVSGSYIFKNPNPKMAVSGLRK